MSLAGEPISGVGDVKKEEGILASPLVRSEKLDTFVANNKGFLEEVTTYKFTNEGSVKDTNGIEVNTKDAFFSAIRFLLESGVKQEDVTHLTRKDLFLEVQRRYTELMKPVEPTAVVENNQISGPVEPGSGSPENIKQDEGIWYDGIVNDLKEATNKKSAYEDKFLARERLKEKGIDIDGYIYEDENERERRNRFKKISDAVLVLSGDFIPEKATEYNPEINIWSETKRALDYLKNRFKIVKKEKSVHEAKDVHYVQPEKNEVLSKEEKKWYDGLDIDLIRAVRPVHDYTDRFKTTKRPIEEINKERAEVDRARQNLGEIYRNIGRLLHGKASEEIKKTRIRIEDACFVIFRNKSNSRITSEEALELLENIGVAVPEKYKNAGGKTKEAVNTPPAENVPKITEPAQNLENEAVVPYPGMKIDKWYTSLSQSKNYTGYADSVARLTNAGFKVLDPAS